MIGFEAGAGVGVFALLFDSDFGTFELLLGFPELDGPA